MIHIILKTIKTVNTSKITTPFVSQAGQFVTQESESSIFTFITTNVYQYLWHATYDMDIIHEIDTRHKAATCTAKSHNFT